MPEIIDKKGIFLPPEIGGRGMIQNSFGPRTCPILTLTGSPSFLVINQVAKVDCRPEETAEGRDKASLIEKQVRKTSINKDQPKGEKALGKNRSYTRYEY